MAKDDGLTEAQVKVLEALADGGQLRRVRFKGPWWLSPGYNSGWNVRSITADTLFARGLVNDGWETVGSVSTRDITDRGRAALKERG